MSISSWNELGRNNEDKGEEMWLCNYFRGRKGREKGSIPLRLTLIVKNVDIKNPPTCRLPRVMDLLYLQTPPGSHTPLEFSI